MAKDNRVRVVFEALLNNFKRDIQGGIDTVANMGVEGERASRRMNFSESRRSVEQLDSSIGNAGSTLSSFERDVRGSSNTVVNMGIEGERASRKMDFSEPRRSVENLNSSIDKAGSTLKNFIKIYLSMKTLNTLFVSPTRSAIELEAQMSRVLAITGATQEEFETLGKSARELGKSSGFGALQIAKAQEYLAMASFDAGEIIKALPGMIDLAASSGVSLSKATNVAVNTLKGFGKEAYESARIADVFARASTSTSAEVGSLGSAMKYVAPMSRAMGVSLEETTAAIGMLSDAGIKGSQAGTTLQAVLRGFSNPSEQAARVMQEIGFNAFDTEGNLLSLTEIVRGLEVALADYTAEARMQALDIMFGASGMRGMITLVEEGSDVLKELTQELNNSQGAAGAMADVMQNNVAGAIDNIRASFAAKKLQIGDRILPALHTQLLNFQSVLDQMAANGSMDRIAEALGRIATVVLEKFGRMMQYLPFIIETIANALDFLAEHFDLLTTVAGFALTTILSFKKILAVVNLVKDLTGAIGNLKGVVKALTVAMLKNPIGLAIAAIGALTTGVIYLWNTSEAFRNFLLLLFNTVTLAFLESVRDIVGGLHQIFDGLGTLLGRVPLIGNAFNAAASVAGNALSSIDRGIANTVNNLNALRNAQAAALNTPPPAPIGGTNIGVRNTAPAPAPLKTGGIGDPGTRTLNSIGTGSTGGGSSSGSTATRGITDDRTALERGMDEVESDFRYRINLEVSRINVARSEDDTEQLEQLSQSKVAILNQKLESLKALESLAKDDKERSLLETAQNRLAVQISESKSSRIRTDLERGMDEVESTFRHKIDLEASRINVARAEDDAEQLEQLSQNKIDILSQKLESLKELETLTKTDKERSLLEIVQNRLTAQMLNILESISETTSQLVGEFNRSSGLTVMNRYQYETRNSENVSIGRIVSTPTVNMYLQFKELGKDSGNRARQELNNFTNAFFNSDMKNNIVISGLSDVLRN